MKNVVIIGAGFAGLIAAIRLKQLGCQPVLIDSALPDAKEAIGGFAMFSGAKFSLPPAGMGLAPLAGGIDGLWTIIEKIIDVCGLDFADAESSVDSGAQDNLRAYRSLVLTPEQMANVLSSLKTIIHDMDIPLLSGFATIKSVSDQENIVEVRTDAELLLFKCAAIFYAGGRRGADALLQHGIISTDVKGLDVGFRVEFPNISGLSELRKLGPDAKIIENGCRTFCLNVPGRIYRYAYEDLSIPGGVVADSATTSCNVGILYRSPEKDELLRKVILAARAIGDRLNQAFPAKSSPLGAARDVVKELYGESITARLEDFCLELGTRGLIDWEVEHFIHVPLIDWHWHTFGTKDSFRTNEKSVFCLGDSSGHARGLMQAAISGWLAAEEFTK